MMPGMMPPGMPPPGAPGVPQMPTIDYAGFLKQFMPQQGPPPGFLQQMQQQLMQRALQAPGAPGMPPRGPLPMPAPQIGVDPSMMPRGVAGNVSLPGGVSAAGHFVRPPGGAPSFGAALGYQRRY